MALAARLRLRHGWPLDVCLGIADGDERSHRAECDQPLGWSWEGLGMSAIIAVGVTLVYLVPSRTRLQVGFLGGT